MHDDRLDAAKTLARKHYELESDLTVIVFYSSRTNGAAPSLEPVKLLEVNVNTVPSGVLPLHFGPAPGSRVDYPSVIIEVTPEEYEKIRRHELSLPAGWDIPQDLPRSDLLVEQV